MPEQRVRYMYLDRAVFTRLTARQKKSLQSRVNRFIHTMKKATDAFSQQHTGEYFEIHSDLSHLMNIGVRAVLGMDRSKIIGLGSFEDNAAYVNAKGSEIIFLGVLPQYRRQKIGRNLYFGILRFYRNKKRTTLYGQPSTPESISFVERLRKLRRKNVRTNTVTERVTPHRDNQNYAVRITGRTSKSPNPPFQRYGTPRKRAKIR